MANSGDPRVLSTVGLPTYVAVGGPSNPLGGGRSIVGCVPDLMGAVGTGGGLGAVGQATFRANQSSTVACASGIHPTTTFMAHKVMVPTNGSWRPNGKLPA